MSEDEKKFDKCEKLSFQFYVYRSRVKKHFIYVWAMKIWKDFDKFPARTYVREKNNFVRKLFFAESNLSKFQMIYSSLRIARFDTPGVDLENSPSRWYISVTISTTFFGMRVLSAFLPPQRIRLTLFHNDILIEGEKIPDHDIDRKRTILRY